MKKLIFIAPFIAIALSGCGIANAMRAMECNTQAIQMSTQTVCENVQAIEEANAAIRENKAQLDAINKTLEKASKS